MKPIRISHNKAKTLTCPRRYGLSYLHNLESTKPSEALVIGNAFHKGIEAALRFSIDTDPDYEDIGYVIIATATGHDYIDEHSAQFTDPNDGSPADMKAVLTAMFHAYIPEIGINRNWRVALHHEVFPPEPCEPCQGMGIDLELCSSCVGKGLVDVTEGKYTSERECNDCGGHGEIEIDCIECQGTGEDELDTTPMLEFTFNVHIEDGIYANGIIDAVMRNLVDDEYIIIDWKTASATRSHEVNALDGQVNLYAAVLGLLGASIDTVAMWEFCKSTPKPASITAKGALTKSAQKTTWDVWYNSLPPEHKEMVDRGDSVKTPKHEWANWQEWAEDRLHPIESFSNYMDEHVSERAKHAALENVVAQGHLVKYLDATFAQGFSLPAINDGGFDSKCKFCPFRILCSGVYRDGDDPSTVIETEFRQKTRS